MVWWPSLIFSFINTPSTIKHDKTDKTVKVSNKNTSRHSAHAQ